MERERRPLTPTQEHLFERLSKGFPTSKMIARDLSITPKTVDKYFSDACRRLHAGTRREALAIWLKQREHSWGDYPHGGSAPLETPAGDGILTASLEKEVARNVEEKAMVVCAGQRTTEPLADVGTDDAVIELAGSGEPPQPSGGGIGCDERHPYLGGEDRETVALGAGGDDAERHPAWNGRDCERAIAPPSIGLWSDEHELSWRGQIVATLRLMGLIAVCSLIALVAVKEILLRLQ